MDSCIVLCRGVVSWAILGRIKKILESVQMISRACLRYKIKLKILKCDEYLVIKI